MKNLMIALLLFGILVFAIGCTQQGTGTTGGTPGSNAGNVSAPGSQLNSSDLGTLDNPDSDSTDPGIPLEQI